MELSSTRGRAELSARPLSSLNCGRCRCVPSPCTRRRAALRGGSTSTRRPGSGTSSSSGTSGRCSERRSRGRTGSSPAPATRPLAGGALRERRGGDAPCRLAAVRVAQHARRRPAYPRRRLPRSRHVIPPVRAGADAGLPCPIRAGAAVSHTNRCGGRETCARRVRTTTCAWCKTNGNPLGQET